MSDLFARYIGSLRDSSVFEADEERDAAERFARAEIAVWKSLLSWASAVEPIVDQLEMQVLSTATEETRLCPSVLIALRGRAEEKHIMAVRAQDTDRHWMRGAVALALRLTTPPKEGEMREAINDSLSYRRYREDVEKADRVQAAAKSVFLRRNLRLVVSIARRFSRRDADQLDLIQEGNLGLIKAIERFDHTLGYRFSTYASWWIRHAISRALENKERAVRLPHSLSRLKNKLDRAERKIRSEGRVPTIEELCRETGALPDKVEQAIETRIELPQSLDAPLGGQGSGNLLDLLKDESASPEDAVEARLWARKAQKLFEQLTPQERAVIRWRFGIDNEDELTLPEIEEKFLLSGARVRQLQERAIAKMRKSLRGDSDEADW